MGKVLFVKTATCKGELLPKGPKFQLKCDSFVSLSDASANHLPFLEASGDRELVRLCHHHGRSS